MEHKIADIIYLYQELENQDKRFITQTDEVISYDKDFDRVLIDGTELTYKMNTTDILTTIARETYTKRMTLSEIEEELGYEIELIEEEV